MSGEQLMQGQSYKAPGVYIQEVGVATEDGLRTGVPVFIGFAEDGRERDVTEVAQWEQFPGIFGRPFADSFLAYGVRGFFANGGRLCYVRTLDRAVPVADALGRALDTLSCDPLLENVDLVCVPDLQLFPDQAVQLQQQVLDFCRIACRAQDRYLFAILDSLPGADVDAVLTQRRSLTGDDGALYYPWIRVADGPVASAGYIPPCGHIAGIYARSDKQSGVHKAPANEVIEEALDLSPVPTEQQQGVLNPEQVNCLRAFPGRGIRVWGARTLSLDPAWLYINVRRLFLTTCRWIGRRMAAMAFEPNDAGLWLRVRRELEGYLGQLHRQGAFKGARVEEAYYVKCDAENNSQDTRDDGQLIVEIGLAIAVPGEFIIVRIVQEEGGVRITPQDTAAMLPAGAAGGTSGLKPVVAIAAIAQDPPGADLAGEYLLLQNLSDESVEMTNWVLCDLAGHRFIFPRCTLQPGAELRVWTRSGENTLTELYWGHWAPLWNNAGDAAYLCDAQDNPISSFVYKAKR